MDDQTARRLANDLGWMRKDSRKINEKLDGLIGQLTRIADSLEAKHRVEPHYEMRDGKLVCTEGNDAQKPYLSDDKSTFEVTKEQRREMMEVALALAQAPSEYIDATMVFEPLPNHWGNCVRDDIVKGQALVLVDAAQLRDTMRELTSTQEDCCESGSSESCTD